MPQPKKTLKENIDEYTVESERLLKLLAVPEHRDVHKEELVRKQIELVSDILQNIKVKYIQVPTIKNDEPTEPYKIDNTNGIKNIKPSGGSNSITRIEE